MGLSADDKYRHLLQGLAAMGRVVVAFSGGLDSTLLLRAAHEALGKDALGVTLATPYAPAAELDEARRLAVSMGVRHLLVDVPFPAILRDNPSERCYLCKRTLFTLLREVAAGEGIRHVLDGTNLDDLDDYRPGMRALGELGIASPLLTAGLDKKDIRELSRKLGLAWDKPAGACLLTRLPHGLTVEESVLRRIDLAEAFLRQCGFTAVRLRHHGEIARIEVPWEAVAALAASPQREAVVDHLRALGYRHVTVDLAGYRMGSLNIQPATAGD